VNSVTSCVQVYDRTGPKSRNVKAVTGFGNPIRRSRCRQAESPNRQDQPRQAGISTTLSYGQSPFENRTANRKVVRQILVRRSWQ